MSPVGVPTLEELEATTCAEHSRRPVEAVCVDCGARLCDECSTRAEGVNRCARCLGRLPTPPIRRPNPPSPVGQFLAGGLMTLLAAGLALGYAVARPLLLEDQGQGKNERLMETLRQGLHAFYIDHARWPTMDQGLYALVEAPASDASLWAGPYLNDTALVEKVRGGGVFADEYGSPVWYWSDPAVKEAYVASAGPDGHWDSEGLGTDTPRSRGDDLILWTDDFTFLETD